MLKGFLFYADKALSPNAGKAHFRKFWLRKAPSLLMQEMLLLPMQEGLFHLMQERLLLLMQERLTSLMLKLSLIHI